jgi:hypothetical protein
MPGHGQGGDGNDQRSPRTGGSYGANVDLARWQFAFSSISHFVLAPGTIGLTFLNALLHCPVVIAVPILVVVFGLTAWPLRRRRGSGWRRGPSGVCLRRQPVRPRKRERYMAGSSYDRRRDVASTYNYEATALGLRRRRASGGGAGSCNRRPRREHQRVGQ